MERKLARLDRITSTAPIDGADKIEIVYVGGWQCISGKGNFKPGDRCFFFEPDAALPIDHPAFAFLAARSVRNLNGRTVHVLRTVRLRGVFSQGLVLPLADFDLGAFDVDSLPDGEDFSSIFGVEKYEAPPQRGTGSQLGKMQQAGNFPSHVVQKSDSERCQNLTGVWDMLRTECSQWLYTEKIDGTSVTFARDEEGFHVCSRNFKLYPGENVYWTIANRYNMEQIVANPGDYVQGEIAGPGIQGNPLQLQQIEFFCFNTNLTGMQPFKRVPVIRVAPLPATVKEALELADGMKSLVNPTRLAEGIVFHNVEGRKFHCLGFRSNLKAISRAYESKLRDAE